MARYVVRRLLWMVVVLFAALLVTLSNFVVDLAYRWLVPGSSRADAGLVPRYRLTMAHARPTDAFGPVRSRLLAIAEYLRARPLQLFVAGAMLIVASLTPFHFIDWQTQLIGLPAALVSLIVSAGAVSGGPRVGIALAIVGGVVYDMLAVSDRWLVQGATSAAVIILWLAAGLGVGLLGDRYRGQVARSLDQAHRSRDALDRVVGATPLFHARGGPSAVARAICDVALETFDCDLVALFAIEDERLRLLARSPYLAKTGERLIMEPSFELQQELAENLLPQFIHDIREPFGPRMPRAITADRRRSPRSARRCCSTTSRWRCWP